MITDSDVTMNVRRGRGTIARRQTSWSRNLPGYDPSQQNVEGQNRLVQNLLGMTRSELEHFALKFDQPRYRGAQLYRAIYNRRARRFPELTDLNRGFRQFLAAARCTSADQFADELLQELSQWSGRACGHDLNDDITLVAIHITGD